MVVKNHRGMGLLYAGYVREFCEFNTFVGDVKLCCGKFYYEAEVRKIDSGYPGMQLGFVTEGFQTSKQSNGEGVDDDGHSWGFDVVPSGPNGRLATHSVLHLI